MRTAFIAVCFVLCLSSVFTADHSRLLNRLDKLSATKFGKTILETIQVELKTKEDPRPIIENLLEQLINETEATITRLDQENEAFQKACNETQEALQSDINGLEQAIEDDTNRRASLRTKLSNLEEQESSLESEIQGYVDQMNALTNQRNKEKAEFEKNDAKYDKLVSVLEQVRTFIQNRLAQRNSEAGEASAFIQRRSASKDLEALAQVRSTVESAEFQMMSPGYSKMVAFIANKAHQALNAEPSDVDTPEAADAFAVQRFGDITGVIDQLIGKFREEKQAGIDREQAAIELYQQRMRILGNSKAAAEADLAVVQQSIAQVEGEIALLTERINRNTATLQEKKEALQESINRCNAAFREYQRVRADRVNELALLNEVLQIVQEELSGLRSSNEAQLAAQASI